jgi:hypothetical protein
VSHQGPLLGFAEPQGSVKFSVRWPRLQQRSLTLKTQELNKAKRGVTARLKASLGQGKSARGAKRKAMEAKFGLGMSPGMAAHVVKKKQANKKQKIAEK